MRQPNVIFVMTDDQGYGDLGCTGNPIIQTPHLDRFASQAARLNDYHVSPLCTPTRGAIMSARYPLRNGAWATTWGRSMLRAGEPTMANVFAGSGYRTGMFGKWHLGDTYPYRPQDRGFQHVVWHRGGGVGQTPDYWGNNYFDDTYWHGDEPRPHDGYCTDIWFDEAIDFIEGCGDQPFFCYLATNAPHAPFLVPGKYSDLYADNPDCPNAAFYGMITNIDENFGRLRDALQRLGVEDDTILIFTTDNGTSAGWTREGRGFNGGMRGTKGALYDGGHRVPFFMRWPNGNLIDSDVNHLINHIDLVPTFIDMCGLTPPAESAFDGISVAPQIAGSSDPLPDREIFVQYRQNTNPPSKWEKCAVMTQQWRLIGGEELYDIKADPGQQRDIAAEHPDVVARLRAAHEAYWSEVEPDLHDYCPLTIGSDRENPVRLDAFDLMGDVCWNQPHIREALKVCGKWSINVEQAGTYRFAVRRWPTEVDAAIQAAAGEGTTAIEPTHVALSIADFSDRRPISRDDHDVVFECDLAAGRTILQADFVDADDTTYAAYYVYVEWTT